MTTSIYNEWMGLQCQRSCGHLCLDPDAAFWVSAALPGTSANIDLARARIYHVLLF